MTGFWQFVRRGGGACWWRAVDAGMQWLMASLAQAQAFNAQRSDSGDAHRYRHARQFDKATDVTDAVVQVNAKR